MGGIYFILKTFGGESTLGFARTAMGDDRNYDWRRSNRRRRKMWRIWGTLQDRSIRSGTRG